MKLSKIYEIINTIAPKALSDEYCANYGAYDNSGILVDTGEEIDKIVFSLDFSLSAVKKAVEEGAQLIVTRHPAIYGKISEICVDAFDPLGEKLNLCIKNGISVISMHLNLDCAKDGIDESLQKGLLNATKTTNTTPSVMHRVGQGGYGRVYAVNEISIETLAENIKKEFSTKRLSVYKNNARPIKKIASFCGAGADEETLRFAIEQKADIIISSDFKHHILAWAREKGLSVIALTHYASENYGYYQFYKKISQSLSTPCIYYTDEELL